MKKKPIKDFVADDWKEFVERLNLVILKSQEYGNKD